MKKVVAIFVILAAVMLYLKANTLKSAIADISMENLEAIAQGESGDGGNCRWEDDTCSDGTHREECLVSGDGNLCQCGAVSRNCR